jgi:Family of unknown function (DUF6152)
MKKRLITLSLFACVLASSVSMSAHHGNAAYDMKPVILKGATVTNLAWANPHTIIQFDMKDDNGKVMHWAAELGSPSALGLLGWTKTSVKPGDVITVYIHQSKTGNPVGRIDHIVLPDGSQLRDSSGGGDVGDSGGRGRGNRSGEAQY